MAGVNGLVSELVRDGYVKVVKDGDPAKEMAFIEAIETLFDATPVEIEKDSEGFPTPLQSMRERLCMIAYGLAMRMGPKSEKNTILATIKAGWAARTGRRLPGAFTACEDEELLQAVLDVAEVQWLEWKDKPTWAERKRSPGRDAVATLFADAELEEALA